MSAVNYLVLLVLATAFMGYGLHVSSDSWHKQNAVYSDFPGNIPGLKICIAVHALIDNNKTTVLDVYVKNVGLNAVSFKASSDEFYRLSIGGYYEPEGHWGASNAHPGIDNQIINPGKIFHTTMYLYGHNIPENHIVHVMLSKVTDSGEQLLNQYLFMP